MRSHDRAPLHWILVKFGHDVELRQLVEPLRLPSEPLVLIERNSALQGGDEAQHPVLNAG